MEREWRIWLGFCAVVLLAVMFVLARNDDQDDPSQLSAGTTLPTTSTVAPSTTVTTMPPTTTSSSSTTPPTAPPTTGPAAPATTEDTVAPTTTPPTAAPTTPPPTEPQYQIQFGPGIYLIGIELPAGTYRTDGGPFCFWARLSSLSGRPDSVIVGENTNGRPATVAINPADTAFTTNGCAVWLSV